MANTLNKIGSWTNSDGYNIELSIELSSTGVEMSVESVYSKKLVLIINGYRFIYGRQQ